MEFKFSAKSNVIGGGIFSVLNDRKKELLERGYSVIYFTAFQLFDILSKGVFDRDADAIAAHHNIFDCDLLIIDDLGTENKINNVTIIDEAYLPENPYNVNHIKDILVFINGNLIVVPKFTYP